MQRITRRISLGLVLTILLPAAAQEAPTRMTPAKQPVGLRVYFKLRLTDAEPQHGRVTAWGASGRAVTIDGRSLTPPPFYIDTVAEVPARVELDYLRGEASQSIVLDGLWPIDPATGAPDLTAIRQEVRARLKSNTLWQAAEPVERVAARVLTADTARLQDLQRRSNEIAIAVARQLGVEHEPIADAYREAWPTPYLKLASFIVDKEAP